MRMFDEVDQGLREAGYNRHTDCVTPNTTYRRIDVLSHAHRLAGLPFDRKAVLVSKEHSMLYGSCDAPRVATVSS